MSMSPLVYRDWLSMHGRTHPLCGSQITAMCAAELALGIDNANRPLYAPQRPYLHTYRAAQERLRQVLNQHRARPQVFDLIDLEHALRRLQAARDAYEEAGPHS